MTAKPVLKWAGGKTRLLTEILDRLPAKIDTYYEPFVGGGAVFFALAGQGRFRRAVLADQNPDLIEVYRALQKEGEEVIRALREYKDYNDEQSYYQIRAQAPRGRARRAARFIYLNKTGYNGLYRVNRSGSFNVPFGRYKNPKILDEPALRAASAALEGARLRCADFEHVVCNAAPGDAVYFDPPYLPLSKTANFTAFGRQPFELPAHKRLARVFTESAGRGVHTLLSNSSTDVARGLYAGHTIDTVQGRRSISCKGHSRGPVDEILVTGGQDVT